MCILDSFSFHFYGGKIAPNVKIEKLKLSGFPRVSPLNLTAV